LENSRFEREKNHKIQNCLCQKLILISASILAEKSWVILEILADISLFTRLHFPAHDFREKFSILLQPKKEGMKEK
jgi:hypothetical protein